jgi:amino-acid N-acetyltransferase
MQIQPISYTAEVEALLQSADLPTADLPESPGLQLFGIADGHGLIAVVGVERHGGVGLLRSLAVAEGKRGTGLGRALVRHAEAWAAGQGIDTLYLLTRHAAGFFARLGYVETPRAAAPAGIAATAEFSWLCPASAAFMRKALR